VAFCVTLNRATPCPKVDAALAVFDGICRSQFRGTVTCGDMNNRSWVGQGLFLHRFMRFFEHDHR